MTPNRALGIPEKAAHDGGVIAGGASGVLADSCVVCMWPIARVNDGVISRMCVT